MIKQQVEQFENVTMPSDWSSNYKTYIDQNYVAVQVIKSTYNVKNYEENPGELRTSVFFNRNVNLFMYHAFFNLRHDNRSINLRSWRTSSFVSRISSNALFST